MNDDIHQALAGLQDRYAIEDSIGRGGMADVYKARDLKHGSLVALKVLRHGPGTGDEGAERFQREIRTMRGLTHPYILPVLDSGSFDGRLYYSMPYIAGESLRDLLRRQPQLPAEQAVRVCREVAEALEYAHRLGVVHRDLKPDNILISEGHAVVADFGISRALGASGHPSITETGVVLGALPGIVWVHLRSARGAGRVEVESAAVEVDRHLEALAAAEAA
jgi:serine/threonine-protein kinase